MNVRDLINRGANLLTNNSESPRLDSSILLAFTLNMDRGKLLASYPDNVSKENENLFLSYISKRVEGYPIAYILGEKEFYGYNFYLEEGVLTPRPDTEILVETSIEKIKSNNLLNILDMCTGTGCIGITIKKEIPKANVIATDISPIAERVFNINNSKIANNEVNFIHSNLFEGLKNRKFDLIATNPPYLTVLETEERMNEGWKEPSLALDGGSDGLDLIRTIINESPSYLNKNGWLLIEADPGQMSEMKNIMINNSFTSIEFLQDLAGFNRVIVGRI